MMRVRSDGALLGAEQLRALGEVSTAYARGTADVTDRQNIQYHWIRVEDVPAIWQRLEGVGLEHHRGLRRLPPPVPRLPRRRRGQGRDHRRLPRARRDQAPLHRRPGRTPTCRASSRPPRPATRAWTPRPRSTTSASSAPSTPSTAPASTSGSAAACRPTRCWPRSSASGSPLEDVADVWEGVVGIFRDYGYRRLRSRARLKFLVADWGVEKFREVLESERTSGASCSTASRPPPPVRTATTSACTSRRTA